MNSIILALALISFQGIGHAEETVSEKAKVTANSANRGMKKGMHRTQEAFCGKLTGDSKLECLAKEAKHKLQEGGDAVSDKASEMKNKADTDKD